MQKKPLLFTLSLIAGIGILSCASLTLSVCAEPAEEQIDAKAVFPVDSNDIDRSNQVRVNSYSDMIEATKPAVVTISSEKLVRKNVGNNSLEDFLRHFYGIPVPDSQGNSSEPELVPYGLGSGVIVSQDGYILTNNHVVTDENGYEADEVKVVLADDREFTAEIVGRDEKTDIAVLKIEGENLPCMPMADSKNLRVGDIVFAIGNPMGLNQTVTMGIVSATGRSIGILRDGGLENFIQTDAAINVGNSGGALIDAEGRLVGINSAIMSQSGGNIGLGFAVPVNLARSILVSLVEHGEIQRGYLGIYLQNINQNLSDAMHLDSAKGTLITDVEEDSPAEKAGLKRGDVITQLNGKSIDDSDDLRVKVAEIEPGTEIAVTVVRNGEEKEIKVLLGSSGGGFSGDAANIIDGVTLEPLDKALKDTYNIRLDSGLVVTSVDVRSPYRKVFREGMVILEVNGEPVNDLKDLKQTIHKGANSLYIAVRRGYYAYIAIQID
jgi:serine protease Do/serine protease DegQ